VSLTLDKSSVEETNCSPEFKKKQAGHVINLGSIAGREPYVGGSIYNATKAAVSAFTGALLRELVNTPIRVTEIAPGQLQSSGFRVLCLTNMLSRYG
jgi:NADP-dependent 3-hydroxy acid dehydrogenase YdfG